MTYTTLTPLYDEASKQWRVTFTATDFDRVSLTRDTPCRHAVSVYAAVDADGTEALIGQAAALGDCDNGRPVIQINIQGLAGQTVTVASWEKITEAHLIGAAPEPEPGPEPLPDY